MARPPPHSFHSRLSCLRLAPLQQQDLLDAAAGITSVPGWASACLTTLWVVSSVAVSLVVTDLGTVLHMIGGTAAR
jgi:hypothetical protein